MSEFTGNMISPSVDDVRYGTIVNGGSGNFILPAESSVLNGIGYGSNAVEFSGTYINSVTISQGLDLFIYNKDSINENINLFIDGKDINLNNVDLFIKGPESINNSLNLFNKGYDTSTDEIDLFIHGFESIHNHLTLSIHGTCSGLPLLETGDDNFGITLDQLFKNADYNPQIIGRFIGDPNSVTIEVWNNSGDVIALANNDCYQIGDTGRWAWSTINLLPLTKIVSQFIFRMTGDNAEVFESQFILHTRRKNSHGKVPRNNSHIRKI
jgi:hypothetical protein